MRAACGGRFIGEGRLNTLRVIFSPKMLIMLALGFAAGVPFLVTKDILKAWLTESDVSLAAIGLSTAFGLPYTFKFAWAPLMDVYVPPFLGRRRGWILLAQICLAAAIIGLGQLDPKQSLLWIGIMALSVTFFSATQDIAIDAHRREFLKDEELGFGTAVYMNAYRGGNLASIAAAFLVAEKFGYDWAHVAVAGMLIVGAVAVLLSPEPQVDGPPPRTLREGVVEPFKDFFKRRGAILILLFILLYKVGDNMASAMNVPFILKLGFEKTDYLVIVKGLGLGALFIGMLLGGALMVRLGLYLSLIIFGILQMVSTAGFAVLAVVGKSTAVLTSVVTFEFLSMGLGTAAYGTFMAMQTNKRFTATQYALLTSLMAVPGVVVSMFTGYMAEGLGWTGFYLLCAAAAIPGLLLIPKVYSSES